MPGAATTPRRPLAHGDTRYRAARCVVGTRTGLDRVAECVPAMGHGRSGDAAARAWLPCSPSSPGRRARGRRCTHRLGRRDRRRPRAGRAAAARPADASASRCCCSPACHDLLLAGRRRRGSRRASTRTSRRHPTTAIRCRRSGPSPPPTPTSSPSCSPPAAPRRTRSGAAPCCCRRSASLAAEVGPLAHLDVGTSAGLNLLLDRYHYTYVPGWRARAVRRRVVLTCETRGRVPAADARCRRSSSAVGLDRSPVDVHDPTRRRGGWRRASGPTRPTASSGCGPPSASPARPTSRCDPATPSSTPPALVLGAGGHPVVTNTWVLNYLSATERRAFVDALDACGRRARPVVGVRREPGARARAADRRRPHVDAPRWCSCAGARVAAPPATSPSATPTATGCSGARSGRDARPRGRASRPSTRATGRRSTPASTAAPMSRRDGPRRRGGRASTAAAPR